MIDFILRYAPTIELLTIAAVISSIVAYSSRSSRPKRHEMGVDLAAQGQPNSRSRVNPAQSEAEKHMDAYLKELER
jgi:hypothetical protein